MNIGKIREKLKETEYNFLRTNENLQDTILLGLGGSIAYGTNTEASDIDLRGIALNPKSDILLGKDFSQVIDKDTDTVVYSFNKMIELLSHCNPNTIEILGLLPEHYMYISNIGKELLDNKKLFLSKICVHTFGEYASSQLRRLQNKSARLVGQAEHEAYILRSINNARYSFKDRYFPHDDGTIKLYIDDSVQEGYDSEIFMDIELKHYPLRDWTNMWNEMKTIVSSYNKIGKRNEKAISHDKLGKHMAHLIRLYMMCIDILETEEIITYRAKEHDLLMDIRLGKYLDENKQPIVEFYDVLNEYEKRFDYARNNTSLPDLPNYKQISEFRYSVNERIIQGGI